MSKILIALGGNALGNNPTEQKRLVKVPAEKIAELAAQGHKIVVGHGNGPQVGMIFNAFSDAHKLNASAHPAVMLPEAGAMSQGYIGLHMVTALTNAYAKKNVKDDVVYFLTETIVNENDPAFKNPSKPVGPFYKTREEAVLANPDSVIIEDAGRGYRKVVASPQPINFIGIQTIKQVVDKGNASIVVGGGGGVPVVESADGEFYGVDGVIDKDAALSKIADLINADIFVVLTAVKWVYVNYKKPDEKKLENVKVAELERYLAENQFAAGSMKPKIEAAIKFVKADHKRVAYIGDLHDLADILAEKCGTKITA